MTMNLPSLLGNTGRKHGHGHGGTPMPKGHIMEGLSTKTIAKFFPDYGKGLFPRSAKRKSSRRK